MAKQGKIGVTTGSPNENYNPLQDDLDHGDAFGYDTDTEYEPNSLENSSNFGGVSNFPGTRDNDPGYKYGITPPSNPRERKRSKERKKSGKGPKVSILSGTEIPNTIFRRNSRTRRNGTRPEAVRDSLGDDPVICDIEMNGMDPSEVFKITATPERRKKEKNFKTSRAYDRDYKNSSGDLTIFEFTSSTSPLVVDSHHKFSSLNSKPVVVQPSPAQLSQKTNSSTGTGEKVKQMPMTVQECPKDRVDFYEIFSTLINMGNSSKKEKERESKISRQHSTEQEVWQNTMSDLIWLELQAWHTDRTITQQDTYVFKARYKVPAVLNKIVNYKVHIRDEGSGQSSCQSDLSCQSDCNISRRDYKLTSGETNPTSLNKLHAAVNEHKVALLQVVELLEELEQVEVLYPTLKAVGRDHPLYAEPSFQHRLNTLCLWMNITKDIGHKLQLMAKVLYVDTLTDWPWLDYVSPHQILRHGSTSFDTITPDILVTTPDSLQEGLSDSDENDEDGQFLGAANAQMHKNVRFNISDSGPSSPDMEKDVSFSIDMSDTSTPKKSVQRTCSILSYDDNCRTAIYRNFVDKTLKKTGLRKLLQRLKFLLDSTWQRARQALERPKEIKVRSFSDIIAEKTSSSDMLSTSPSLDGEMNKLPCFDRRESLADHGTWSKDFAEIGLPSFKPMYLFLVRIPLDVVHECLRLRLEQRPETDPSTLSVRQLIRECKEVLLGAVLVKQWYQLMVNPVVTEEDLNTELDLEHFEADIQQMLDLYFDNIQTWMNCLQEMPEMSKRLKNFLEEEWNFSKRVCPHVRGGDAKAGNRFCLMASSLLRSISDFLDTGIDECINQLYDSTTGEPAESHTLENQDPNVKRSSRSVELRQAIIQTCRNFKVHFHEARERASKALGFAKMLRKDLEIAADFEIAVTGSELMKKLEDTRHHQVLAPHNTDYQMFIPNDIAHDRVRILQLLNVTRGSEVFPHDNDYQGEGYLLLIKCEDCSDHPDSCPRWNGTVMPVDPTAENTIALSHIEVNGMFLVVSHSSQLGKQTKYFLKQVGDAVKLASEQTSCHQAIAESLAELKNAAVDLRERVVYAISQVNEKLNLEDISEMDEVEKINIQKLYRETLHQCFNFGFEYHKEVIRLVSGEQRTSLAQSLVEFAKLWMKFVSEKCERGRGLRPRWATQGLEFLCVACEPRVMATLSEDTFTGLKADINRCITHVIGDKGHAGNLSPGYRVSSPDLNSQRHSMLRHVSMPEPFRPSRSISTRGPYSEPPTPFAAPLNEAGNSMKKCMSAFESITIAGIEENGDQADTTNIITGTDGEADGLEEEHPQDFRRLVRVRNRIYELEKHRTTKLYHKHVIGRVTEQKVELDYHISIRRVNFKWQRGIKIGEGQFGKVYTAVNMDTGQMMAVKEIRFQPNDHQTIKDIADEIKLFEGITHPSLVQYYGVELHRDEMLIFMEYCTEGTIEEVAKQGIPEALMRRYMKEIMIAIKELHDHGIVHRDIKGANIFLTSNGPVKLGDFGCSIKLKSHTTIPGEVNNMVGTTAFMAPEVITRNEGEGSGRAADIWSLGCVGIEIATGKRPWYELENNYQIMFKVGMGAVPPVPENLSLEGQDFLSHCLQADPKLRYTASQLQDHPFVKVYSDDEAEIN